MRMIGVYLEDPDIVPSEELRSIACVTIDSAIVSEPPLEPRTLDGGEYGATPHGAIMPKYTKPTSGCMRNGFQSPAGNCATT